MRPEISVIIPTRNRPRKLRRCVESLFSQDFPKDRFEILVVDDASVSGTRRLLEISRRRHRRLNVLRNDTNKGAAFSRNRAIKKARGRILVFTDDDCVLPQNWLSVIRRIHEEHPCDLGIGGPTLSLRPGAISRFRDFQRRFALKRNRCNQEYVTHLPTCNISYKREAFRRFGLFEDRFVTAYGDDVEFNMRLVRAGKPIRYEPSIEARHEYPESLRHFIWKSYTYGLLVPLVKKRHPMKRMTGPRGLIGTTVFIAATGASLLLKIGETRGIREAISLFPYILIDELSYRWGGLYGMFFTRLRGVGA